ncbi:MAG: PA14 domain-containing protein, partial [Chthoniobacterales bacterium]
PWDGQVTMESPMLPSAPLASEGPSALALGPMVVVYHDFGLAASGSFDLENWFEITNEIQNPKNWRHGTVRQIRTERFGTGGVRQEYWEEAGEDGQEIDPDVFASGGVVTSFALPTMEVRNWEPPQLSETETNHPFQQRVRALLTPPESGEYRFWVSGDERAELWMNVEGENPAGSRQVAFADATGFREWDGSTDQRVTVQLEAGKSYYLELRHRDDEGPAHASVGWLRPGESGDEPSSLVPEWALSAVE